MDVRVRLGDTKDVFIVPVIVLDVAFAIVKIKCVLPQSSVIGPNGHLDRFR